MIEVATEPVQKETLYRRMLKEIVEVKPSPDLCHTQFPPQVVIESTAACNQNCTFCGRSYLERPKGHMPRAIYNRIVDEIARESPLTEILPAYMGEALLLGDELFDRMATARRLGCRKITLNTNGTLVEKHVDRLLEGNIDRISVSCDAHTEATPSPSKATTKVSGLEGCVLPACTGCLEERARRGLARPFVEVGFTVFGETEHEVDDFVRYWSSYDVIIKTRPKGFLYAGTVPGGDYRITTGEGRTPCGWLGRHDDGPLEWHQACGDLPGRREVHRRHIEQSSPLLRARCPGTPRSSGCARCTSTVASTRRSHSPQVTDRVAVRSATVHTRTRRPRPPTSTSCAPDEWSCTTRARSTRCPRSTPERRHARGAASVRWCHPASRGDAQLVEQRHARHAEAPRRLGLVAVAVFEDPSDQGSLERRDLIAEPRRRRVHCGVAERRERAPTSSAPSSESASIRAIAFSSSRTLPGQSRAASAPRAAR